MAKSSPKGISSDTTETAAAINAGDMEEKNDNPRKQQLQGLAYSWKGFLSTTTPQTYSIFKTKNVIKISLGSKHCAFLTDEHAVYCYGSGEFGQLGNKKYTDVTKQPVVVQELKGENVIDVVCGANHTGVVCSDGIVFCWGDSSAGQCGTGESEKINTPRQVEISDTDMDPVVTQIACGDMHTLALTTHGEVWAWGTGVQLGLGTGTSPVLSPCKVNALVGRKVLQISCGALHSLAIVQKVKQPKLVKKTPGEDEESGSGSLSLTNETFTMHEEDDTVIITDTRIKDSAATDTVPSVRSFSPDSIDMEAKRLLEKNGRIRDGGEEGYASSEGSQGTYTLNDSQKDIKSVGDSDIVANGDVRTSSDQTDGPAGSEDESCIKNGAKPQPCMLPTSSATLEYFAQLKPKRPTTLLSSKERILASLPAAVSSKLEKLMSPRLSLGLSLGLGLWPDQVALKDKEQAEDEQEEESDLNRSHIRVKTLLEGMLDELSVPTDVWSWGKGASGQLGQGDPLDKPVPIAIKHLSNKNIVHIIAGMSHNLAITNNGQVFSWGSNTDGQLGHTGQLLPKRIKMPNNALVWDAAAGTAHTLLVADGNSFQPDVYYLGKQPSLQELRNEGRAQSPECPSLKDKDGKRRSSASIAKGPTVKYAARAKQPEKLGFIRKNHEEAIEQCTEQGLEFISSPLNGWVQAIAAAGDMCACIVDKNVTGFVSILHELTATERLIHNQLSTVKSTILKTLQAQETHKALEDTIYSEPFKLIVGSFSSVANAVAHNSMQLTTIVQKNQDLSDLVMLKSGTDYVAMYERYAVRVCNFLTVGGFAHLGKICGEALSKHEAVFCELLNEPEKPPSFGPLLRTLMKLPLDRIKCYAYLLKKLTDYFAQDSHEHKVLTAASALWDNLQGMLDSKLADAEVTRKFWESCPTKLAEAIKRPDRRLLRDSRSKPLNLGGAGILSTHWFLLFNDIFVHAQTESKGGKTSIPTTAASSKTLDMSKFSTHQAFPLALVWAEPIPNSDQAENSLQLTMPEVTLLLCTPTPAEKAEWLWSINQAIDNILTNQRSQSASPKGQSTINNQRVPPKLARSGCYTFCSNAKYKDAAYEGVWFSGKPHGKGTVTWPDGKKFTGNFIKGQQQGIGVYTIPCTDGKGKAQVYEGQFVDGKMTGVGTLRYHNGDIFQGNFEADVRHGHGVFHGCTSPASSKPNLFIGEWQSDHRHGYGVMEDTQRGEKYMGMWDNDLRHGNGLVITLDGLYYEGAFSQNKLQGTGVLLTEDGTIYEGELTTGPTLNGKGKMTLPSSDHIEGTFNGLWGDGVKVNGTFTKGNPGDRHLCISSTGKFTVLADQKWSGIFDHCQSLLGYRNGGDKPDCHRAWEAVAVALSTGRRHIESQTMVRKDSRKFSATLEELERIPVNNRGKITEEDYKAMQIYLAKAFDTGFHPLGQLMESLVIAYRETYIGLGAHRWLLPYAVEEVKSYVKRIYQILRSLFPELPSEDPTGPCTPISEHAPVDFHYYYDYSDEQAAAPAPVTKCKGERPADDISSHITSEGLLYPLLIPRVYPALFTLYALKNEKENEKYQEQIRKLNKQPNIALMAYLKVDQKFWLLEDALVKEPPKKLSEICGETFQNAVDCLQKISTTFSPRDKLQVIKNTWKSITEPLQEKHGQDSLGMDELFPIFHYVVIRARIPQLGSEIQLINDILGVKSDLGQWGHIYTTLEGCYLLTIDGSID